MNEVLKAFQANDPMNRRASMCSAAAAAMVLVVAGSGACSDDDSSDDAHQEALRADPLATADLPGGVELEGFEIGAAGGQGPLANGEVELGRRWSVDGFTEARMAEVVEHLAAHDVYFFSLRCRDDYITAAGHKRIGPFPGVVSVRLELDESPEAAARDEARVSIVLRLHNASVAEDVLPSASYSWQQAGNDPDGAGCDQQLIETVEESQARQPPSLPAGTATSEPRDLGG